MSTRLQGQFVTFIRGVDKPKTQVWKIVTNETGERIGVIEWYGPWRKYAFKPDPNTVWEPICMREVTDFMSQLTITHQALARGAKKLKQ